MKGTQGDYRRIYPSDEAIVFDGGIDTKFSRALIPDNESPDCANVIFDDGTVGTRDGFQRLNTLPAGTSVAFDGLYTRRANDNSQTMLAFVGGHMYALGSTTFVTVPSAQSVFTMGQRVALELAENYAFIGNGGAGPYKWNGSLFTQHGISAPVATAVLTSGTTGSLTSSSVYQYAYTHVNTALVESDISPRVTFTVSTAARSVVISNIAVGSFPSNGVNARYVYRTQANGTPLFRITILNDNTTASYTDTTADTSLGAAAPTDQGVPPQYNAILYHRNILFVNDPLNPNYVRYSALGQPYSFPSTNFFKVGDNASDIVRGFASYDNHVLVFCDQSVWLNFMADPATPSGWRQIPTNSPYGSRSPYCMLSLSIKGNNVILFPAMQSQAFAGFAALAGIALDPTSTLMAVTNAGSNLQSDRIEPDMFQVQTTNPQYISGSVFRNRAYITLTYGAGNTVNNRMYCFDFSASNLKKTQSVSWVPFTGIGITQMCDYNGKLYGATSGTTGFVYQIVGTGVYNDDGAAIDSYLWTKEFPGFEQDVNSFKDFRYVNILVDNAGTYFMNLSYKSDSDKGTGDSKQLSVNPGGSTWGSMVFGRDFWGGGDNQSESRIYLGATRGKRLQLKFSNQNTINQRFKVHRCQFAYNLRGFR